MKENLQWPERLKVLMDKRHINALSLSKAIGVSHVAIGNFLDGQLPKAQHLIALADMFGVTTDHLLGRYDQPNALHDSSNPARTVAHIKQSHREEELNEALLILSDIKNKCSVITSQANHVEECIRRARSLV